MYLYKEQNKKEEPSYSNLSMTKPKEPILKTGFEKKIELKTMLKQKSKIIIYVKDNKYFVEHAAAYALGLIKTRTVMMDSPKLVELSIEMHNKLKAKENTEIEYIYITKKQPIKVYYDESNYCIDNGAAYALGLMNIEEFNNSNGQYFYITKEMLAKFKEKFEVEIQTLSLKNSIENRHL